MKTICALTGAYEIDNERHFVKNHRSKHTFALNFIIFLNKISIFYDEYHFNIDKWKRFRTYSLQSNSCIMNFMCCWGFFSIRKSPKDIVQMPIKGFLRTVEETVVSQILTFFISL